MAHSSSQPEQAWERQPKESIQAYEAFCIYRDMPYEEEPEKRSIRKVAEKLNKTRGLLGNWSTTWNWQERCREYDNELQRIEFEERKEAIKQMQERHLSIAMEILSKAEKALEGLPKSKLDPKNLLNYIIRGIEIERRVRIEQMGGTITAGTAGGKNAVAISEIDEAEQSVMTQLIKSLEEARRARKERKE